MQLTIRNFRGVSHAEITLTPLALVCGPNASGKSSIAQALAALLSGQVLPLEGLRKADAAMLVRSGGGASQIALERKDERGESRAAIAYPQAKLTTEGAVILSSPIACGLESLTEMDAKQAASTMIRYLNAQPRREDLDSELTKIGLSPEHCEKLWNMIQESGWDGAHAHAKETGVKFKGQWEEATAGERYGSNKAESWLPAGWETDLTGASETSLQAAVTQAREFADAAVATTAISDERRRELQNAANLVAVLRPKLAEAQKDADAAALALKGLAQSRAEMPKPVAQEQTCPCPHCAKPVVIRGQALHAPAGGDTEQDAARARALAEIDQRVQEWNKVYQPLPEEIRRLTADLAVAERAAKELAGANVGASGGADADALERARRDVQRAEARLSAHKAKLRADTLHRSIARNQAVVALLAADGLRLGKLRGAIKEFNGALAPLCQTAQWGVVSLSDDLTAWYDGRPWTLLSVSERMRVRVTLQARMAVMDGAHALVFDAADTLDRAGRNGLMRLIRSVGVPALVCMTIVPALGQPDARAQAPVLKGEAGRTYWVEGGTVEAL
jgi:energy-coupling factor transporter ATP-binding protein EcfA2